MERLPDGVTAATSRRRDGRSRSPAKSIGTDRLCARIDSVRRRGPRTDLIPTRLGVLSENTAAIPIVRPSGYKVDRQFTRERWVYTPNRGIYPAARPNDPRISCPTITCIIMGRNDRLRVVSPGHDRWDTVSTRPSRLFARGNDGRVGCLRRSARASVPGGAADCLVGKARIHPVNTIPDSQASE